MEDTIPLTNQSHLTKSSSIEQHNRFAVNPDRNHNLHALKLAWRDIKLIAQYYGKHRTRFWIHIGLFLATAATLLSNVVLFFTASKGFNSHSSQYCAPGGSFEFNQTYDPWDPEHTFQITLGFGILSFAQAKAIDVVWDVVVGRGGQFLVGAICFHVFSKSLNRMLEQPHGSLSYDAFRAIVFEKPTLTSTLRLVRDVTSMKGWRATASIVWIVIASLYVVAFPTMVSAMTGYSANVHPYFDDGTSKMRIDDNDYFHRVIYRVNGADRIQGMNLTSTYLVGSKGFGGHGYGYTTDEVYELCASRDMSDWIYTISNDCILYHALSNYTITYRSVSSGDVESLLILNSGENRTVYHVSAPILDIEFLNVATTGAGEGQFYVTKGGDQIYNAPQLRERGTCDSQKDYMWGFSYILLFGFLVITGIWELGMYAMWHDAYWNSRLDRAGRTMGFYRGIIDISDAMWKDTLKEPWKLASESQIRELLAEKLSGGRIAFDEIQDAELVSCRKDDWARFKQNISLLSGWTTAWTLTHWAWFALFSICGSAWFFVPLADILWNYVMYKFAWVASLIATGICWAMAVAMFIAGVTKLKQWWTKAYWTWILVFVMTGLFNFYIAISLPSGALGSYWLYYHNASDHLFEIDVYSQYYMWKSVLIIDYMFAGIFWLIAATMLLTGLFSTIRRWSSQSSKARRMLY